MKLMRVGQPGQEKPAILDAEGQVRDLSAHVKDIGGEAFSPEGLKKIAAIDVGTLPVLNEERVDAKTGCRPTGSARVEISRACVEETTAASAAA